MSRPSRLPAAAVLSALLAALSAPAASLPSPDEAAYTDPAQIQTEAYIRLAQADQALDENNLDEARAAYADALALYSSLAADFPDFSPAVVSYRSAYCRNQLETVASREAPEPPPAQPAAAPVPAEEPAPSRAASRRDQRAQEEHAREVAFLREQIDALKAELASTDETQDSLSREIADLRAENTRLQVQLDSRAEISPAALKQLRTDFEFAKTQVVALQRESEASRGLNQALNDAEAQTAALRERIARLEEENALLSDEIDDLGIQLADAEAKNRIAEFARRDAPAAVAVPASAPPSEPPAPPSVPAESVVVQAPAAEPVPEPAPPSDEPAAAAVAEPAPPVYAAYTPAAAPRALPAGADPAAFVREILAAGEDDAALATVRAIRALDDSGDINLALLEGITLIRLGAYNDALALLIPLARDNPKHAEIRANLGAAMMGAGDYDEARETLEDAVKLDKRLADAHYNLALLYANTAPIRLKPARKHYKQAIDLGIEPDPALEAALEN